MVLRRKVCAEGVCEFGGFGEVGGEFFGGGGDVDVDAAVGEDAC